LLPSSHVTFIIGSTADSRPIAWPIDEQFVSFFRDAKPEIHFIPVRFDPVSDEDHKRYFLDDPMRALSAAHCDRIIPSMLSSNSRPLPTRRWRDR